LTMSNIVYSDVVIVNIKGFEGGFASYSPLSISTRSRRSIVDISARGIFIVGRDKETKLGMDWIHESMQDDKPGLLVIESNPGMGKSVFVEVRICEELRMTGSEGRLERSDSSIPFSLGN